MKVLGMSIELALGTVKSLLPSWGADHALAMLGRIASMSGGDHTLRYLANSTDQEQFLDRFIEALYAFVFDGLGFSVEFLPRGRSGADLRIKNPEREYHAEVSRFRHRYPGPPELPEGFLTDDHYTLPSYGDPVRDSRKAYQKLLDEIAQLPQADSIVAIWNDDGDMEDLEVRSAVAQLRGDLRRQLMPKLRWVKFVVYGSEWVGCDFLNKPVQFHCLPLSASFQEKEYEWVRSLEKLTYRHLLATSIQKPGGHPPR